MKSQPPEGWSNEWQIALFEGVMTTHVLKMGLTSGQFANLVGVSLGEVGRYSREGLEKFKDRFGQDCYFWEVNRGQESTQRMYNFYGKLCPSKLEEFGIKLYSFSAFASLQNVSEKALRVYSIKGHRVFREQFPGWDFVESKSRRTSPTKRWYGRIEDLGEQPDFEIPSDNLTSEQFARLQGTIKNEIIKAVLQGHDYFKAKYPGWDFCRRAMQINCFRLRPEEIEVLSCSEFRKRMGISEQFLRDLIRQDKLSKKFPGWCVRSVPLKWTKWLICRTADVESLWKPPNGWLSLSQFAKISPFSYLYLWNIVKKGTFHQVFPEWEVVEHCQSKRKTWIVYPLSSEPTLPPRTVVEFCGMLNLEQFSAAFDVGLSTAIAWAENPNLLEQRAPGWSTVKLTLWSKRLWFKPPQCSLS